MSRGSFQLARVGRVASRLTKLGFGRTEGARWDSYLSQVEPAITDRPRVHRFGRVPELGPAGLSPAPLAIWIEAGEFDEQRTRDSLAGGTARPAAILGGPLEQALAATSCANVALVRSGDVLAPLALERLGQAATLAPDAAIITCDDDLLEFSGRRRSPRFRPGPSPDRWLACDDSGPLLVVNRERALSLLGELDRSRGWRHELALALAGSDGGGHGHVPMLLCHRAPDDSDASVEASTVARVLGRWGAHARVERINGVRHVRRMLANEPTVEVVVCFRNQPELLARCVESLLSRTGYERLRLALVDNGSVEAASASLLDRLGRDPRIRVISDPRPFNFAALNNSAARSSSADVLVFLNNDTEVIDGGWLEPLLEEASRPEVGAVAPLLLYPNGSVQHAGAALGLHGYAGHPFAGLDPLARTPFGRADGGTRNWLAVTAACMVLERRKFEAVGGFDESFVVAGNDVELCLRLTAAGHRSLCVTHARLVHDESRSRGAHIDPGDFARSEQSYGEFRTVGDPFYNPNLTLSRTDCSVRERL